MADRIVPMKHCWHKTGDGRGSSEFGLHYETICCNCGKKSECHSERVPDMEHGVYAPSIMIIRYDLAREECLGE